MYFNDNAAYKIILIISVILILIFIVSISFRFSGSLIRSDGIGYYISLRSIVFDKDINCRNEYIYFYNSSPETTPTGFARHTSDIGLAILWMPFYLLAHLINIVLLKIGIYSNIDGYGFIYQFAVCIGTMAYIIIGIFLSYHLTRRYFSEFSSLIAVLGVWLGSSLVYYTIVEPSMSQGVQFFTTALFLCLILSFHNRTYKEWFFIGLSMGLMGLVHAQSAVFLVILIIESYFVFIENRWLGFKKHIKGLLFAGVVALFVFIPQLWAWNEIWGLTIANLLKLFPPDPLKLSQPKLMQYLFSPGCSLFTWAPILFLAIIGFLYLYKKDKKTAICLFITVLFQWYTYSSLGYRQGSYGARHFVSSVPIFILALAAFIEARVKNKPKGVLFLLLIFTILLCWNFLGIVQYALKFIPHDGSISWDELILGKFRMIKKLVGFII